MTSRRPVLRRLLAGACVIAGLLPAGCAPSDRDAPSPPPRDPAAIVAPPQVPVRAIEYAPFPEPQKLAGDWLGGYRIGERWQYVQLRLAYEGPESGEPFGVHGQSQTATFRIDGRQILFDFPSVPTGTLLTFEGRLVEPMLLQGTVARGAETGWFRFVPMRGIPANLLREYEGAYETDGGGWARLDVDWKTSRISWFDGHRAVPVQPISPTSMLALTGERIEFIRNRERVVAQSRVAPHWLAEEKAVQRGRAVRTQDVRVPFGWGGVRARFDMPVSRKQLPAFVFVPGPSDRPSVEDHIWMDFLAQRSVGVLVFDSEDTGSRRNISRMASLAEAGREFLVRQDSVDPSEVLLIARGDATWAAAMTLGREPAWRGAIVVSPAGLKPSDLTAEFPAMGRGNFDPIPSWSRVKTPVLLVYSESETSPNVARGIVAIRKALSDAGNASALARAIPDVDREMRPLGAAPDPGGYIHVISPEPFTPMNEWIASTLFPPPPKPTPVPPEPPKSRTAEEQAEPAQPTPDSDSEDKPTTDTVTVPPGTDNDRDERR